MHLSILAYLPCHAHCWPKFSPFLFGEGLSCHVRYSDTSTMYLSTLACYALPCSLLAYFSDLLHLWKVCLATFVAETRSMHSLNFAGLPYHYRCWPHQLCLLIPMVLHKWSYMAFVYGWLPYYKGSQNCNKSCF